MTQERSKLARLGLFILIVAPGWSCLTQKVEPTPQSSKLSPAPSPASEPQPPAPELLFQARVCVLERPVSSLNDIRRCPAVGVISTPLDISPRRFTKGFKGITKETEWFTLDFASSFTVERPGQYEFQLTTDDHALLWIDGKLVLENPPPQDRNPDRPPTIGRTSLDLSADPHRFRLLYLRGKARRLAIELTVRTPEGERKPFSRTL